ncbi:hypothetical protein A2U01_0104119, partial [Trifolium medium]|nr:hypothetical protein [Trifolium medium]
MISANLSILSEAEVVVRKKMANLEDDLRLLQNRKRELDDDISTDILKLIAKNRS